MTPQLLPRYIIFQHFPIVILTHLSCHSSFFSSPTPYFVDPPPPHPLPHSRPIAFHLPPPLHPLPPLKLSPPTFLTPSLSGGDSDISALDMILLVEPLSKSLLVLPPPPPLPLGSFTQDTVLWHYCKDLAYGWSPYRHTSHFISIKGELNDNHMKSLSSW